MDHTYFSKEKTCDDEKEKFAFIGVYSWSKNLKNMVDDEAMSLKGNVVKDVLIERKKLSQRQKAYERGVQAEDVAAAHLREQGFEVLEMRYKTRYGEVDIIVERDGLLVFAEVKARNTMDEGLYAVTKRSQKRIEQAALFFLSQNDIYNGHDMRFDVLALVYEGDGNYSLNHLDNAWQSGTY